MRAWIKNFNYYKHKGYQVFDSEIYTNKDVMLIEDDLKTSVEFASIGEIKELENKVQILEAQLESSESHKIKMRDDYQRLVKAIEFIQFHADTIEFGRERYIEILKELNKKVVE